MRALREVPTHTPECAVVTTLGAKPLIVLRDLGGDDADRRTARSMISRDCSHDAREKGDVVAKLA